MFKLNISASFQTFKEQLSTKSTVVKLRYFKHQLHETTELMKMTLINIFFISQT